MDKERKTLVLENLQTRQAFGMELHLLRVQHDKTQAEWAAKVDIDPTAISNIESAKRRQIPTRDVVIEWGLKWGLPWEERTQLLISGHYLPEFPSGFGTLEDRIVFRKAWRELTGSSTGTRYCEMLRDRCLQLYEMAS